MMLSLHFLSMFFFLPNATMGECVFNWFSCLCCCANRGDYPVFGVHCQWIDMFLLRLIAGRGIYVTLCVHCQWIDMFLLRLIAGRGIYVTLCVYNGCC
jgi:hypothetical protein